jgi:hypothetical protein
MKERLGARPVASRDVAVPALQADLRAENVWLSATLVDR